MREHSSPTDDWLDWLAEHPWLDDELSEAQIAYDAWVSQRGDWITAAAQAGYRRLGRGAIIFDVEIMATETEQPACQYVTTAEIEERTNPVIREMVGGYNPDREALLVFAEPTGRTIAYRIPIAEGE